MPSLSEWLLDALSTPAVWRDGAGMIAAGPRVWAAWGTGVARAALARALERPVRLTPGVERGPAVFAADLLNAAGDERLATLVLDADGARAVADALGNAVFGVRGAGAITAREVALVEFVCLDVLDRVLTAEPTLPAVVLSGVRAGPEAEDSHDGACVPFRVSVGGRAGGGAVYLARCGDAPPPLGAGMGFGDSVAGEVSVCLALPWFALPEVERRSMAPGDVVLPGLAGLMNATGCRLTTASGWTLCDAAITRDAAGSLDLRCGALRIRPDYPLDEAPDGHVWACLRVGEAAVSRMDLRAWGEGREVSLGKRPGSWAGLWMGDRCDGVGEMVAVENEIGLRLTGARAV